MIEGLFGQVFLVTVLAALAGNLGRTLVHSQEMDEEAPVEDETSSG